MDVELNTEVSFEKDSIIMLTLAILIAGASLMLLNKLIKK